MNCSTKISGEHLVSEGISTLIGDYTFLGGLANAGKPERRVVARRTTANILCDRHNSATSPLDTEAAKYFSALQQTHVNFQKKLNGHDYFFTNGDLLEVWAIKTLMNFHYARMIEFEGKITADTCTVNESLILKVLSGDPLPGYAGWYCAHEIGDIAPLAIQPQVNPVTRELGGIKLFTFGVVVYVVLNPLGITSFQVRKSTYRPGMILTRTSGFPFNYESSLLMTWKNTDPEGVMRAFHVNKRPSS